MYNYTIQVQHEGKNYQTSVLAHKDQSEEEVYQIAKAQVLEQWTK
jgi:hypothetical protein